MCAATECTSSSSSLLPSFSTAPDKRPSGIAMDSSVTAIRSEDALSRKRSAARRLSRITMNAVHPHIDDMSNDSTANDYSQDEDNGDSKRRLLASGIAPDHLTLSELSDSQSKSPLYYTDKGDLVKSHRIWPEVNNTIICGYQLVGAGKEFTAYHAEKKVVKTCQLIDNEQYKKLLTIAHRLNEAKNYWKYGDLETMREFVLPSSTEVCTDEKGRRFMFSNWHYGTLHSKVQAGKARLTESETFSLFSIIVRGMAFCHACGIVVRDVKLRKFVFTDKQMTKLRLRDIFDMFVCEDVNNDLLRDRHSCPAYVAPEILRDSAEYAGRPADIWALGVLLYVLLFGSYPFNDATPQRLFFRILKAKFSIPTHIPVSQTARALIFGLLRKEPLERPTAEELLNIPLIDQTLDESNVMSLRSILPSWLEIASSRIVSVLDAVSTPALEFARHIMRVNNENDDQVVPLISSSTRNIQRQLQIMRTVIADTSFTTTISETSSDDLLSSISDVTSSSSTVVASPSATSALEAAPAVYL